MAIIALQIYDQLLPTIVLLSAHAAFRQPVKECMLFE